MFELLSAASRQHGTVAKTKMRTVVQNGHVAFAKESRDRAQRATKSAVEKHRVLALEKFRDALFQLAMEISHSREHWRTAHPHSVRSQRLMRSGQHFRVIGKAKIIVRAKINNRPRFPSVVNNRA